jgi:hypothetical protein
VSRRRSGFPIFLITLFFAIEDLVEQLTRIFLGIFRRLLHSLGRFLKGSTGYIRRIAHIVIGYSTAAIITHTNIYFRFAFSSGIRLNDF